LGMLQGGWNEPTQSEPSLLALALDQLDFGVIICGPEGQLRLANDAARREIALGSPLAIDRFGKLAPEGCAADVATQWRVALSKAAHLQRRRMVPLWANGTSLMATVLPLGQASQACALVLLSRRQVATDIMVALFGKVHDLTAAECCVLLGLVNGKRLADMALERKVQMSTLRAQVASLRAKTGVSRVEDLILMVAAMPPMTSALRCQALSVAPASSRQPRCGAAANMAGHPQELASITA
jgi:DNA-binding CsgD family transcriptional regulator